MTDSKTELQASAIPGLCREDAEAILCKLYDQDPAAHLAAFNSLVATQTAKGLNDEVLGRVRELVDWLHSQEVGGMIATDGGPGREERIVFQYDRHPLPNVLHWYLREWGASYLVGERDMRYPEGTRPEPIATSWLLTDAVEKNAAQREEIQRLEKELFTAENHRCVLMTMLGVQNGSFAEAVGVINGQIDFTQRLIEERDAAALALEHSIRTYESTTAALRAELETAKNGPGETGVSPAAYRVTVKACGIRKVCRLVSDRTAWLCENCQHGVIGLGVPICPHCEAPTKFHLRRQQPRRRRSYEK